MDNFCALPFSHITVDTMGNYAVCCLHNVPEGHQINLKDHGPDVWLNSEYLREVQETFLKGQKHIGCNRCWFDEDVGFDSMRIRTRNEYKIFGIDPKKPKIVNAELQLGNLCNLTCLMCSEQDSSAILAENQRLGINKIKQSDIEWTERSWKNLQKIIDESPMVLNLRGGEPLYNKSILDILEKIPPEQKRKMMIHLTTNATIWNDRWANVLGQFKLIRIMLSVDAIGPAYEYIRFPAKWDVVESNVKKIQNLSNARIVVNAVIQNLNLLYLENLISWCQENNLYLIPTRLENPKYLKLINLPDKPKDLAVQNLKKLLNTSLPTHLHKFIESCLMELSNKKINQNQWEEFQTQITMREKLRGNNHRSILDY